MKQPRYSRRAALRGGAGTAAAVGLTGCLDSLPFVGGQSEPPSIGPIPTDATVVATVDVETLLEDETTRQLADAAIPVTDVTGALELVEKQTELDMNALQSLTGFLTPSSESTPAGGAVVFETRWTSRDLEIAIESLEYEMSTRQVKDVTVTDVDAVGLSFAPLESTNQFVAGTTPRVEDVIDVDTGEAAEVGGRLARAHDRARSGPMQFGVDLGSMTDLLSDAVDVSSSLPEDIISNIKSASGAVYTMDGQAGIEVVVRTADRSTGSQVKQFAEAAPTLISGESTEQSIQDLLDEIEVARNGERVTITLEGTVEELTPLAQSAGLALTTTILNQAVGTNEQ